MAEAVGILEVFGLATAFVAEEQLKNSKYQSAQLKKAVKNLTAELAAKQQQIETLQAELSYAGNAGSGFSSKAASDTSVHLSVRSA